MGHVVFQDVPAVNLCVRWRCIFGDLATAWLTGNSA
jgi:hypothetical protein